MEHHSQSWEGCPESLWNPSQKWGALAKSLVMASQSWEAVTESWAERSQHWEASHKVLQGLCSGRVSGLVGGEEVCLASRLHILCHMPSRQLPDSHSTRDKAFLTARNKYDNTPVADRLLTAAQYTLWLDLATATSAYARWKKEREEAAAALSGQTGLGVNLPALTRALRLHVSHFIQTLNNAVERGALPASDRALFQLAVSDDAVPPLDSEADLLLWSERIAEGEADRVAAGGAALAWPTAGQVAAARTAFLAVANPQSTAYDAARDEQQDVLGLVPATDAAIKKMWDTIEYQLSQQDLAGSALRSRARQWGVVYDASAGEDDDGGTPPPPLPPPAPTGLTFTQENPGDAVTVGGTLGAGMTLVKIFAKLVGTSDEPVQVGAAGTLPTAISGISPGDYEFTATVTTAAGESAPSAPVTLTVA